MSPGSFRGPGTGEATPGGSGVVASFRSMFPPAPAPGVRGDPGLFGPASTAWSVLRERVVLLGGPAALLLQVAHPLVAAGVAEHSDFRADPLHRLRATLDATLTVVFGDTAQARAAAAGVGRRHRRVTGRLPTPCGAFAAGTAYRADDPHLARWVHATLVWTALEVSDRFLAPVPAPRRAAYLAEMDRFARLFGVTEDLLPPDYPSFERYVRAMDDDGVLEAGPQARAIAEAIFTGVAGSLARPLGAPLDRLGRVLAAGLLPPRLRTDYGLPWGWREREAFAAASAATRLGARRLPAGARYWPHYLSAQRRLDPGSRTG